MAIFAKPFNTEALYTSTELFLCVLCSIGGVLIVTMVTIFLLNIDCSTFSQPFQHLDIDIRTIVGIDIRKIFDIDIRKINQQNAIFVLLAMTCMPQRVFNTE